MIDGAKDFLTRPNVRVDEDRLQEWIVKDIERNELRFACMTFANVATTLANTHPHLTLVVSDANYHGLSRISCYHDRDHVGSIEGKRRGGSWGVLVRPATNTDDDAVKPKFTSDERVALRYIAKTFRQPTTDVRVTQLERAVDGVLKRQVSSKTTAHMKAKEQAERNLMVYAHMPDNYARYIAYLETAEGARYKADYQRYMHALMEKNTVDEMYQKACNGDGAMVLCFKSDYIVRTCVGGVDTVNIYTDTTLPYELRTKLGMLKLVEDTQIIANCGCRIDQYQYYIANGELHSDGETATGSG